MPLDQLLHMLLVAILLLILYGLLVGAAIASNAADRARCKSVFGTRPALRPCAAREATQHNELATVLCVLGAIVTALIGLVLVVRPW